MFFCIGVQVLSICGTWVLLWMRNKKRGEAQTDTMAGYNLGLSDVTDRKNPHFKVSNIPTLDSIGKIYANSPWTVCLLVSLIVMNSAREEL